MKCLSRLGTDADDIIIICSCLLCMVMVMNMIIIILMMMRIIIVMMMVIIIIVMVMCVVVVMNMILIMIIIQFHAQKIEKGCRCRVHDNACLHTLFRMRQVKFDGVHRLRSLVLIGGTLYVS
jgi:hypothetical protein